MIDLERNLQEMFRRREGDVRPVLEPPPGIGLRVRRRRARHGLVAGIAAAAVALGSLGGLRLLAGPRYVPSVSNDGTRTVDLDVFEITYPAHWLLTGVAIEPIEDPSWRIVLSNADLGEASPDPCGSPLPDDAVALVLDVASGAVEGPTWPVELEPAADPCGTTHVVATWSDGYRASEYRAQVLAGSTASPADVEAVRRAFQTLRFPRESGGGLIPFPDQVPGMERDVDFAVLAGGRIDGAPWLLDAERSDENGLNLSMSTREGGSGIGSMRTGARANVYVDPAVFGGNMYLWGAVHPDVDRVEIRPGHAAPFDAELLRLPSYLGSDLRAFVAPMTGAPSGTLAIYDGAGALVREVSFAPGAVITPERDRDRPAEGTIADGRFFDTSWVLRPEQTTDVLVLDTTDGDELARTGVSGADLTSDALVLTTYVFEGNGSTQTLVFGHTGLEAAFVVLVAQDGLPSTTELTRPEEGNPYFWGNVGEEPGFAVAYDVDCRFLRAIDLRTLGDAPEPTIAGSPCG